MKIFVFGSSILSSYWNGAATYYRGCYKYLARRGHRITFAEPDAYGRQQHRDRGDFSYVESLVYEPGPAGVEAMLRRAAHADVVVKHSGLGVDDELLEQRVLDCAPASTVLFWDVDAPATIARIGANSRDPFLSAIPKYDAIVTYGGGPAICEAYRSFGARACFSIFNGLDPETHHPVLAAPEYTCDLVLLANRLPDREARVDALFLEAASLAPQRIFLLGGEGWGDKELPPNVRWIGHVPTAEHNRVNSSAGMVMNINRSSMAECGYSPPTRIFEAAGAAACMLCDAWTGIEEFFVPGEEIRVVSSARDVVVALDSVDRAARQEIGRACLARALRCHTYAQRAEQFETALQQCISLRRPAHWPGSCDTGALVEETTL